MSVRAEPSVARSTALSTAATLVGYATTLIQQLVLARALGVSASVDGLAAAIAWAVATTGIIGWSLASVVVPLYIAARANDPILASALFRMASALASALGATLALVTFVGAEPLASALLPGSTPLAREMLVSLLRITAPLHLVWTMGILASSLANARRHYVAAGLVTVIPSLVVIATLIVVPTVEAAAAAYVVGMLAQVVVLVAVGRDWRADLAPLFERTAATLIGPRLVPVSLTFLFLNVALIAVRSAASLSGAGDLAALDYALRLTLAGESVLLTGGLAVALTVWSEDYASGTDRLPPRRAIAATLAVGVGVAAVLAVFAAPIVRLLFGGGRFAPDDVDRVAIVLASITPGMAARMVILLAFRLALARQATRVFAGISAVALLAVAAASLLGVFIDGLRGAGLGYSIGWLVAALLALFAVRRTNKLSPA